MAEPFAREKQLSIIENEVESNSQTALENSTKPDQKFNLMKSCLTIESSSQNPILAKNVILPSISSASTSRPTKNHFSMDKFARSTNEKLISHHRSLFDDEAKTKKGKEPLIHDEDESKSSSNKIENEHKGHKDINNRLMISAAKRERIYDLESEKLVRGKKMKILGNGNCSFTNWVTTITNGLTKPQHMKGAMSPPPLSQEERKNVRFSHGVGGFISIFQAMYNTGNRLSSNNLKCIDYQKEVDSLKKIDGEKASKRFNFGQQINFPSSKQIKNYPTDSIGSRHVLQSSIWITQLSCGVSSPPENSINISNHMDLSAQNLHTEMVYKLPNVDVQTCSLNEKPLLNSIPVNDSDHCKRTEPMISSFQQRCNALKEDKPVKLADEKVIKCISTSQKAITSHKIEPAVMNRYRFKTMSSSWENALKKSEFKFFCRNTAVMNKPKGILAAIRKLQLSRTDLLRCMKSKSSYSLGGYFLRLRIGNQDKGFGAISYHVACINRTISHNSISVCVGNATYSVNTCFISNQNFDEAELQAWWFQKVRDGIKMPSIEDLNEKLQLRLKLGF